MAYKQPPDFEIFVRKYLRRPPCLSPVLNTHTSCSQPHTHAHPLHTEEHSNKKIIKMYTEKIINSLIQNRKGGHESPSPNAYYDSQCVLTLANKISPNCRRTSVIHSKYTFHQRSHFLCLGKTSELYLATTCEKVTKYIN